MLLSLSFLAAPWLLFFWQLSSEFSLNPTYQFALLAPVIMVFLAWEKAYTALQHTPTRGRTWIDLVLLAGFVCLLPLRLIFEANADWRLIQWLQGLLSAGLTLGGLYRWGGAPMLKKFAALACLPLLCIPWPTSFEKEISTHLMSAIATASIEAVHLMGMEAHRVGNLIFLPNGTTVGVEEACAGLRSLAGNLFAAGVIGEMLSLTLVARLFLLGTAVGVALLFNLVRSLILVLTAALSGTQWTLLLHDTAGWSILIASFGVLYLIGKALSSKIRLADHPFTPPLPLPRWLTLTGLLVIVVSEPLVDIYYPVRAPAARIQLNPPGAIGQDASIVTRDAERFRTLLFYDRGDAWRWKTAEGDWQLFFFEWRNPRLSRLGGAYHRPERCLPNTGWRLAATPIVALLELPGGITLPATLTHFVDIGGRHATLLFAHCGDDLSDIGLDTRLNPAQRWADFLAHRRLSTRTALQLSIVSGTYTPELDRQLIEKAQAVLSLSPKL